MRKTIIFITFFLLLFIAITSSVKASPTPSSDMCTDTDILGTIEERWYAHGAAINKFEPPQYGTDKCVAGGKAREYYCGYGGEVKFREHLCPYGCYQALGACHVRNELNPAPCEDFDGELTRQKSYFEKSYATKGDVILHDYCKLKYAFYETEGIYEALCRDDGSLQYGVAPCYDGCRDGACINVCRDTDDGKDFIVPGKAYLSDGDEQRDICDSDGLGLYEGFCNGDELGAEYVYCPDINEDYVCKHGTCGLNESWCKDSDNGLDYFVPGSVTVKFEGQRCDYDYCQTSVRLEEMYCNGDDAAHKSVLCSDFGDDYVCMMGKEGGACRQAVCGDRVCHSPVEDHESCPEDCFCSDSDVNEEYPDGHNPFVKGERVINWGEPDEDICSAYYGGQLVEMYCIDESSGWWEIINCTEFGEDFDCVDGACVPVH